MTVRDALEPQVRRHHPDLLPRLELQRAPRPRGYGILPELEAPAPPKTVPLRETVYSLARLAERLDAALADAARLAAEDSDTLVERTRRFETLADTLRNLDAHLDYHAFWQADLADRPAFYRERNRLVAEARAIRRRIDEGAPAEDVATERAALAAGVAPFQPTAGLALERRSGGRLRLTVPLCTDIEDRRFLAAFRKAVDETWNRSPAARARRFAVRLQLHRIAPGALYPDGPPSRGAPIDLDDHRRRFGECRLVLTTGARNTHARLGDAVFLGSVPLTRRVLAHEFAHLLGFGDAYLRGFDGEPGGPDGATLVEWTGLADDLMGSPGHGRVDASMIETLIRAYAPGHTPSLEGAERDP